MPVLQDKSVENAALLFAEADKNKDNRLSRGEITGLLKRAGKKYPQMGELAAMLEEGVLEKAARGVWGASRKEGRYSKCVVSWVGGCGHPRQRQQHQRQRCQGCLMLVQCGHPPSWRELSGGLYHTSGWNLDVAPLWSTPAILPCCVQESYVVKDLKF
jgi:hypothetical protein